MYAASMAKYAPGVDPQGYASEGFQVVMSLYNVLKAVPAGTPITAASATAALQGAKNVPLFMGGGATFTCDHSVFKDHPSICGKTFFLSKYTTSGGMQFVSKYEVPPGS